MFHRRGVAERPACPSLRSLSSPFFLLLLALLPLVLASCARPVDRPPATLAAAAEAYVRLALALGERDPDALDGYTGPSSWQDDARARHATLPEIERDASDLAHRLESTSFRDDDPQRHAFLIRHARAIAVRSAIVRGAPPPFADEARELFGITRPPPAFDGAAIHLALDTLLPGRGDLAARYADFDRRFLVPPDRLPAVLARAIAVCRQTTRAHLDLPASEHVTVDYVANLPWSAFTHYEGGFASRVQVNTRYPLTVDRALDLACHEAYPGHHTIDVLFDAGNTHEGTRRTELFVRLLFAPESLIEEGAASLAPDLVFDDAAARERVEREQLFPLAGLNGADAARYVRVSRLVDRLHPAIGDIAWRYLSGTLEFARASEELTRTAVMPQPDVTLKFLNQFRSYGLVYTVGRDYVARIVDAHETQSGDGSDRWRAYVGVVTDLSQR